MDRYRRLAMLIAEALTLADELDLRLVGISLDSALTQLGGLGFAAGDDGTAH